MASTYLTRSKSSPTSDKKGTISFWVKRSKITQEQSIIQSGSGSIDSNIYFNGSNDKLHVYDYQSGAFNFEYITTRVFRDTSAWYAITVEIDTSLTTASDRVKIYINGVRETVFDTATTPNQNITPLFFTSANPFYIGSYRGTGGYFDGLLSHFHYTDGYAYGASTFGSTDSTTGEWSITTSPSITMGNNGFTILKDGNTITDQSSNSNDFSLGGGTLTNTEDCPSNVFATLNPLHKGNTLTGITYSNGNNTFTAGSTAYPYTFSTLANSSGKYYAEFKVTSGANNTFIGISAGVKAVYLGHNLYDYSYVGSNGQIYTNQASTNYGSALSTNDILGVAMDLDNNKLYFSINGTWQNSANPSSGTGGHTIVAPSSTTTGVYHFAVGDSDQLTPQIQCNFGNGFFGSTAISSEGTNASGIGKFELDVPNGFTALSTKGLNL